MPRMSPSLFSFLKTKYGAVFLLCSVVFLSSFLVFQATESLVENYCAERYSLLNPRWRCLKEPPRTREFDELMTMVETQINTWEQEKKVSQISVFFRDLYRGSIFSINGNEQFAPASLLKVPIMIAIMNYAEDHPEILDEKIMIDLVPPGQNVTDPHETLVAGQTYTIREIMRRMIVYSDNASKEVLREKIEQLSPGIIDQTFIDLGIALRDFDGAPFITIKSYAAMLRTLYNASYLSKAKSEEALTLLTTTNFNEGLVAGVPPGTTIAHKFGYLNVSPEEQQLHDCGIIYHPENPYLLCIMTRGSNPQINAEIIGAISRTVYQEINERAH